jgi:hypothetical protein
MRNPSHESRVCATEYRPGPAHKKTWLAVLLGLATVSGLQATVLDNFNGPKTGWTDTLNGGTIVQSGGQFTVTTANPGGSLTYSLKTSTSFAIVVGDTLELRADVGAVSPGNPALNPMSVLGWVPNGGTLQANGYALYVGSTSVIIKKGASVLYSTTSPGIAQRAYTNSNITLVLRLTPSSSSIMVDARVYLQTGSVIGQDYTCLVEYTATDPSGTIGTSGYAALGALNQASASGASVAFANLQYFVLQNSILDDFSVNNGLSGWTTFAKASAVPGITSAVTEHASSGGNPGYVDVLAGLASQGGFAGAYYAAQTFKVVDGSRLEFSIDFDNPGNTELNGGGGSYAALGYLPVPAPAAIYSLSSYHISHDILNGDYLVAGKNYDGWWTAMQSSPVYATPSGAPLPGGYDPAGLPVTNLRYRVIMTGEGTNERIEARLEDNSLDVNDPNHVVFQNVMVDTPASDFTGDGATLGSPAPYLNYNGAFVMLAFDSGPVYAAHAIFRNAQVSQSIGGASPPAVLNLSPLDGTNYVPSSSSVSFEVRDAVGTPATSISLTLNGVTYRSGSPGIVITGTAKDQLFTLTGALADDMNYVGLIQATNSQGLTATPTPIRFDTFKNAYIVELEEFNYSPDGGATGGSFLDNPKVITDDYLNSPGITDPLAYNGNGGLPGVDYHNNRDASDIYGVGYGSQDVDHVFRWNDAVRTTYSSDYVRAKYASLGGIPSGYFEVDVEDIHDGDWQNYTHTYPAGTYAVYLREEQYLLNQSIVTLERVTSDRTQPSQTTAVLGSFLGSPNGSGPHFNVPLTDAAGNLVIVRFSGGVDTLRVNNRVTGNASTTTGFMLENYLVLAPVPNPGTLRPIVSAVSPLPGQQVSSSSPATYATIVNRDTTVETTSIQLKINGAAVPFTVTPNSGGAELDWSLSVLPPAPVFTNTLIFKDSAAVWQTNSWTYSYPFLSAANSLPVGGLSARGFQTRMAWSGQNGEANMDNSLSRALQQLAIPPQVQVDLVATSIVAELNWNITGTPNNVPGLCGTFAQPNNIAVESLAYLHLTAGAHRFRVNSDDRAGFYSGTTPWDTSAAAIFESPDNTANQTFDFVVGADGLYPFRSIWEQTGGGAVLQLLAVDLAGVNADAVVGDPGEPPGAVDVYYPIVCASSSAVTGPYAFDPTATATTMTLTTSDVTGDCGSVVNQMVSGGSGTFTVPMPGSARFYRISAPRPSTITHVQRNGSNIVITYTLH